MKLAYIIGKHLYTNKSGVKDEKDPCDHFEFKKDAASTVTINGKKSALVRECDEK